MHVLVIESDPIVASAVMRYMSTQGATVSIAQSAMQAIQACDQHIPDVIVLDISLTGHSGIEFLHEFKSYSDWHHVPVIAWSMQAYTARQQNALATLGVQCIFYKPAVSLRQLWQQINDITSPVHA